MKYLNIISIAMVFNLAIFSGVMAANNGQGNGQQNSSGSTQQTQYDQLSVDSSIVLSNDEETDLFFMREEEKLARDVYLHFAELWGAKIFTNISNSEQKHMDSVKVLLDAYNLSDPALVDQGFFTDPDLQELYDQLIAQGAPTLIAALKVGALIEEIDINDLYQAINRTTNPAIIQVYTKLLNGSYSHLNAFVKQLFSLGVTYEPEKLSVEEVESILSGEIFNPQIVDGLAIDNENNPVQTQARFSHTISSDFASLGNNTEISANEPIKLSSHFIPEAEDIGQMADSLAIAYYQSSNGQEVLLARTGEQWTEWNGDPQTLTTAGQQRLREVQELTIFQGELNNLQGKLYIYVGYRLNNGKIVYSSEPMSFNVN